MTIEDQIEKHPCLEYCYHAYRAYKDGYVTAEQLIEVLNRREKELFVQYESLDPTNYRKLLTRCMEQWLNQEGGCWSGEDDKTITDEEEKVVRKIYKRLIKQDNERIEKNQLLEDFDIEHDRNIR
ncbi:MAG: hypothetical protein JSW62_02945 [Thermoplasmatales archaeon]|nr:MAG: hypothetical protein JSW62_02945 [Thermoplasmatales archaeon]